MPGRMRLRCDGNGWSLEVRVTSTPCCTGDALELSTSRGLGPLKPPRRFRCGVCRAPRFSPRRNFQTSADEARALHKPR